MLMNQQMELRASVISILFGPSEDGYTMVSLKNEYGERLVAAGRAIPSGTHEGDELTLTGKWVQKDKGPVFMVQTGQRAMPRTQTGIQKWLEKAKVPGIGKIKASQLVARFGMDTINAIVEERDGVHEIIGRKKAPQACEEVRFRRQEAEIGATLSDHGIGPRLQKKIIEKYKDKTHKVLTENPYKLIMDIDGVAFNTADKIAQAAGLPTESPQRIQAAIVDTLRDASREGHCALYHQQLMERCRKAIYVREPLIEAQLESLTGKHIVETHIRGMRAWATVKINRSEKEFARHVVRKLLDQSIKSFGEGAVTKAVKEAQKTLDVTLSEEQEQAAIMALMENLSIIIGGPGTGKTHTLKVICEAWKHLSKLIPVRVEEQRDFAMAAPTGKAAKRITESTGHEGKTIHRLLEYKPEINGFERNQANPLLVGLICIDESSMPDIYISNDLGRAWGQSRVLLVGDTNQLPSVGPGKVLADLLESGIVPHTRLTRIFRQAAGSEIAIGADAICAGKMPQTGAPGKGDLVHIELSETSQVADRIVSMYIDKMPAFAVKNGLDPSSIQVLCPGHQSEVGTIALNRSIQTKIQESRPKGHSVKLSDGSFATNGDKVIQLENDYERNIFNGDTGVIVEVEKGSGNSYLTHVDFGGVMQTFEGVTLSNLSLAYALSIHKSQGSEYQIVIIPVTTSHFTMLKRTLLYTGTTRAKRLCVYVGTSKAIRMAVQKEDSTTRITTLCDALMAEYKEATAV